jgi:hypothetical protein
MAAAYCTVQDVRDAVSGTDHGTGTAAALAPAQIEGAISRASTRVGMYAGSSWVPDSSHPDVHVPDLVRDLTVQLAAYYATLIYRKGVPLDPNDPVALGYADAMKALNAISNGEAEVIPAGPGGDVPGGGGHVVNTVPRMGLARPAATAVREFDPWFRGGDPFAW